MFYRFIVFLQNMQFCNLLNFSVFRIKNYTLVQNLVAERTP